MNASKKTLLGIIGLGVVMGAEALVFQSQTAARAAWIYPRWTDQLQYLGEAYRAYEQAQKAGFLHAAWGALTEGSPQGSLHAVSALIAFEVAGPTRGAALSVNMAAFLFLQLATFLGARRVCGSSAWALAAAAFLAAFQFPWVDGSASAVDFRLDWLAVCASGVAVAWAASGRAFRSFSGAALLGVFVGLTILTRFLSAVYYLAVLAGLFSWFLALPDRRIRCARLLVAAAVAAGISGPVVWLSRHAIYRYYWQSFLNGPDSELRAAHMGALSSVGWILQMLFRYQIGMAALAVGLGSLCLLAVLRGKGVKGSAAGSNGGEPWGVSLATAATFLAAPACVLLFIPIKDPQHVSFLLVPLAWMLTFAWSRLARRASPAWSTAVALGVVAASLGLFVRSETRDIHSAQELSDFRAVDALGDYLYFRSEEAGLDEPTLSVAGHFEGIYAQTFEIMGFERHHRRVRFTTVMPTPLVPLDEGEVMDDLGKSDFVCLISGLPQSGGLNSEMAAMHPRLKARCEAAMRHAGDVEVLGCTIELYEQRALGAVHAADLEAMVRGARAGVGVDPATPPAAPLFIAPPRILASTKADFRFEATAAYSPITYVANALPEGIRQRPGTCLMEGRFAAPGDFVMKVAASNPAGSHEGAFAVHVEDKDTYAVLAAPAACRVGEPVDIGYGGYDALSHLDFVEVTDLTAGRTLGRIEVPPGCKQSWLGTYRAVFDRPGHREILTRTVRFDPDSAQHYSFEDRTCRIEVAP